ncbi:hypothetical protein [Streptomyces sp. NBC_00140]|uniref:hypothetical protein n=1 Tax=Streptomyces sp. NBC_00140 TaxID=2975664 RepID=UPI0022551E37|nr:hypothetical protein [Streptomyces sp. NBC_00140]MCX5336895.1 hypothetical protein [Streptomyces sp. NBC_00140]MCX5338378.1 hypothetical protein [Streptomyces sp. NBC_00140]
MAKPVQVTAIQTGAERGRGEPARTHNEPVHDRTQQLIAETRAGIAEARARNDEFARTGRYPR